MTMETTKIFELARFQQLVDTHRSINLTVLHRYIKPYGLIDFWLWEDRDMYRLCNLPGRHI